MREQHDKASHPRLAAEGNAKRGRTVAIALKAGYAWGREQSRRWDPATITGEILPGLHGLFAAQVARAVGISTGLASQILKGRRVPYLRLWEGLRALRAPGLAK